MATNMQIARDQVERAGIRLRCWGDFALCDAATGLDLKPRGRKARALLAYLALHPGRPVSRERLAGLLWGDRGEEQARASLRQAITELRPLASDDRQALLVDRDHLAIRTAGLATDLDLLREATSSGAYDAVLAALPDPDERLFENLDGIGEAFDDWLRIERTRQRDALIALLADAAAQALACGDHKAARALLARNREFDPAVPAPVDVPGLAAAPPAEVLQPALAAMPQQHDRNRQQWQTATLIVLMLTAAILALGAWQWPRPARASAPSIAVLPFKSLSGGSDAYFAEGITEELTTELGRQAGLRVAGRSSSGQYKGKAPDPRAVASKLGVTHILDGSVRSARGRVRVHVALVRASDGLQLWAETFDGTLDDIFAIQSRIGAEVAGKLQQRFAGSPAPARTAPTSGAVYSAYLTARSLIRERNPRAMIAAKAQLGRALALDPGFAPAWSSMAQVRRWEGNAPGDAGQQARAEALVFARRALALAPDLAEAHGVLGMILNFDDPEGQRHIKRAAALDPSNAEFQFWLGHVHGNEPDFPGMLAAYRRAFAIDPLWTRAQHAAIQSAWRMGQKGDASSYVRRVEREGSRHDAHMARGLLAAEAGDLSHAVRELGAARASTGDLGRQAVAAYDRASLLLQLGLVDQARGEWRSCRLFWEKEQKRALGMPDRHAAHLALRRGDVPSRAQLRAVNAARDDPAGEPLIVATANRLIQAGRARDVVALYDGDEGLLGFSARRPAPTRFGDVLQATPVIATALIAVDRRAEADRLLRASDRLIASAYRISGGRVPHSVHAEAARIWALLGKREEALAGIERAHRAGWINANFVAGDLVDDIGDEPAFAALRGDPRFESIRARMNAQLDRERREVIAQIG